MVSISADAIVSVDESQKIILFNRGAVSMFQYAESEVLGQPLTLLIPEQFRATHEQHVRDFGASAVSARQMGERGEIYGRRKSGEQFPAEASISKIEIGGERVYTAVLRDITARKQRERERLRLLEEAREARAALEAANERLIFLSELSADLEGSLDYAESLILLGDRLVNRLADFCLIDIIDEEGNVRRLHGVHRDPERAGPVEALSSFAVDRDKSYLLKHSMTTGESRLIEDFSPEFIASVAQSEEHERLLLNLGAGSCMCVPLVARGHILGAIALFAEPTRPSYTTSDLRFAEVVCRRAAISVDNTRLYRQSQRAIGLRDQVLGVVSHDLRNPLSVISMVSSTLTSGTQLNAQSIQELGGTIREATSWMHRLIGDLLDIASIESGHLSFERRPCDPVVLVMKALGVFEQQVALKSLSLEAELPEHLPRVSADPQRALQVLTNLVGNAIKFTDAGGRITVGAARADSGMVFTVSDTGRGIDPEDLERIFDRFWQKSAGSRVRGTGLGLAIAKGIVEAHGGRIWADSSPGHGSTFYFTLPLAAPRE